VRQGEAWLFAGAAALALGVVAVVTRTPSCPPGQLAIELSAQGPGWIGAGGTDSTRSRLTICPRPGDQVAYQAWPDPGHTFVRFEGPGGVTTTSNPFTAPSQVAGFVRAVFS